MKKLIGVTVVFLLLAGCATVNGFFCSPTQSQTAAADTAKAMAQVILAGVASLTGNPIVTLISINALPVFDKVIQGYCVAQADWDSAVTALQQASQQTATKTYRGVPASQVFSDLNVVKW